MGLEVKVEVIQGVPVIKPIGDVDILTADTLRDAILKQLEGGSIRVVIDLMEVGFLDSTGLMVLIQALSRTRKAGGGVALVDKTQPLRPVIRVTGLNKTFGIYSNPNDAVKSLLELVES